MRTVIRFTLLLTTCFLMNAQSNLTGLIVDEELQPIPAASVSVLTPDKATFIKAAITDDNGKFLIKNLASGDYIVMITSFGFKDYFSQPFVHSNKTKDLGVIKLNPAAKNLDEVVLKAEKPMVQVMADKTVFNVQNTINATGDSGFTSIKAGWKELCTNIRAEKPIKASDQYIADAVLSWHEEEKDMALLLSRKLSVLVKFSSKSKLDLKK